MCLHVERCTGVKMLSEVRGVGLTGAGLTSLYEPPGVDAMNQNGGPS